LGKLLSVTLVVAMCSNLVLLPAFLVSLERRLTTKAFLSEPLFVTDQEEDDIELDELSIRKLPEEEDPEKP
jgi:predicted RND superfamily exporter protein